MRPLLDENPRLQESLPHISLGQFPTPIQKIDNVAQAASLDSLYIKRDDLSGLIYGGNKVRKLEFILAEALRSGAREVVTVGFAGSNHALATAIYARQSGLKSTSMLMPQRNAHYVRRNLLASNAFGAELCPCSNLLTLSIRMIPTFLKAKARSGRFPAFIPAGGSSPLGILGYVSAAFELSRQIDDGEMPAPDLIYLPMGSMGTAVGLALGLKAAGLRNKVLAVRVIEKHMASARKMAQLFEQTVKLLRKTDPAFPRIAFRDANLEIRNDCLGPGYACFTEEGNRAAQIMKEKTGLALNGAYSAKAFSAILNDAGKGLLKGKTVLFWNTYNSRDLSSITAAADYRQLPKPFHTYFENPVQPLDQNGVDQ